MYLLEVFWGGTRREGVDGGEEEAHVVEEGGGGGREGEDVDARVEAGEGVGVRRDGGEEGGVEGEAEGERRGGAVGEGEEGGGVAEVGGEFEGEGDGYVGARGGGLAGTGEGGGGAYVMASLLMRPCIPRVRKPPRSLIISRRPRRWARRSLTSPQSHSSMMSWMTPVMPSSDGSAVERMCSLSSLMAKPLWSMARVVSMWPVSLRKQAAVYMATCTSRGDWTVYGTWYLR